MSATQEDVLMDLETKRFEKRGAVPMRREVVQTLNLTVGKKIDNLLFAASEMRKSHRHIFMQQEDTFVSRRGKYKDDK
ncbi:hypothetical protein QZH41_014097 [Actinostola sp. cb2023]|nr:hypothetical protein QZH41_014097 [Actinostola sp. cb2023]